MIRRKRVEPKETAEGGRRTAPRKERRTSGAEKSAGSQRQQGDKGELIVPANPWRAKAGQPGNPGGRPQLLSDAYVEWLGAQDEHGVTNAAKVALALGARSVLGDVRAAKELRSATEGTRVTAWQDEIIALVKSGQVTPDDVIEELGDDDKGIAEAILVAAGVPGDRGPRAETARAVAAEARRNGDRRPA